MCMFMQSSICKCLHVEGLDEHNQLSLSVLHCQTSGSEDITKLLFNRLTVLSAALADVLQCLNMMTRHVTGNKSTDSCYQPLKAVHSLAVPV